MNSNNNQKVSRRRSTRSHYRNTQVKITRSLLAFVTLVAIVILLVHVTISVGTMFGTCFKLWNISDGVRHYENAREEALYYGQGKWATECDEHIVKYYAARNELINSDNPTVAFTAQHKWAALGYIMLYIGFIAGVIALCRQGLEKVFNIFTKVIDVEEFLLRMVICGVSFLLMTVFSFSGCISNFFAKAFSVVWNQSKPRRKPASHMPKQKDENVRRQSKVVSIGKGRRRA